MTCACGAAADPIVHDGTFGGAGPVLPAANRFNILPQRGTTVGPNLFHSFSSFSVPAGATAFFSTNAGTRRVIARVTGGEVSRIDGTLATGREGTSLFLLNPSGVIFGDGASIDVRGSFHAVAGDYLALEDGGMVWADPARAVSLSSAPVVSFGFLAGGAGGVRVEGAFLESRADLLLAGRTVTVDDAGLQAAADLRIVAAGAGDVEVALDRGTASSTLAGPIGLSGSVLRSGPAGGRLSVEGGDLVIRSSSLNFENVIQPLATDLALSSSGSISLLEGSVLGAVSGAQAPQPGIDVRAAGAIRIHQSAIQTFATSTAAAPPVRVAGGSLEITGNGGEWIQGITSNTFGSGAGADIAIEVADGIRISNAGLIASFSSAQGRAGNLSVDAGSLVIEGMETNTAADFDFLTGIAGLNFSSGEGGRLNVRVRESIELRRGGLIDSSSFGAGDGGGITVDSPSILIDRAGSEFFTGIGSDASSSGKAGAIAVRTDAIDLLGGGLVSSSTSGSGPAGDVFVSAGRLDARGSGRPSAYVFSERSGIAAGSRGAGTGGVLGDGGSIRIEGDVLRFADGAALLARTEGPAVAGDISLAGRILRLENDALLSVESAGADGGSLSIDLTGSLVVRGSVLEASAGGNGGNISIASRGIQWFTSSRIAADARGAGGNLRFVGAPHLILDHSPASARAIDLDGGAIRVATGTFFANESPLSVTSRFGAPGTVRIETLESLDGGEEARELELLDPADALEPDCSRRAAATASSFVRGGRGGTRRLPGGYLPSFRIIE